MLHAFAVALGLLTRLPVRLHTTPSGAAQGLAVATYPLVGLLLGLLLWLFTWLLVALQAPPLLAAALLVVLWTGLTGALHLDGLADSADAWLGAHGDRERALAIMKDPACGPAGVVALLLVLLVKTAALAALLAAAAPIWLLLIPLVLGRSACAMLFLCLTYARESGLGTEAARHLHRPLTWGLAGGAALAVCLPAGRAGLLALAGAGLVFVLACRLMQRLIGGFTGDTAGALVETVEAVALTAVALILAGPDSA